jgi:hypothetical protein
MITAEEIIANATVVGRPYWTDEVLTALARMMIESMIREQAEAHRDGPDLQPQPDDQGQLPPGAAHNKPESPAPSSADSSQC